MKLATRAPELRKVNPLLRISFLGKTYDVSGVPGVIVGQKLTVARNAFGSEFGAQALFNQCHEPARKAHAQAAPTQPVTAGGQTGDQLAEQGDPGDGTGNDVVVTVLMIVRPGSTTGV